MATTVSTSQSLTNRRVVGELMDDPSLDAGVHRSALAQLAGLNSLAAGHRVLWPALRDLSASVGRSEVRALDVATGSGDIPVRLVQQAAREGVSLRVDGCDASPVALAAARERAARAGVEMNFFELNAIDRELPGDYDVVMCSLFLHHLADNDAIDVLYKMRCAAQRLVLVSDLVRSRTGLALAWAIPRVLNRSRIVRVDAVRSVEAAFTVEEMGLLAEEAGMEGATVRRRWPQRMLLSWRRA